MWVSPLVHNAIQLVMRLLYHAFCQFDRCIYNTVNLEPTATIILFLVMFIIQPDYSSIHSFVRSFVRSFVSLSARSLICSLINSFILFIHPPIHPSIRAIISRPTFFLFMLSIRVNYLSSTVGPSQ